MARLDHRDVARTPGLGTGHRQHPRQLPSDLWKAADGQGPQAHALQDRRGGRQGRLRSAKARKEEMVAVLEVAVVSRPLHAWPLREYPVYNIDGPVNAMLAVGHQLLPIWMQWCDVARRTLSV